MKKYLRIINEMWKKVILIFYITCLFNAIQAVVLAQADSNAPSPAVITLVNEGIELHKKKDYKGAIKAFEDAILIEPNNKLVLQNLSVAHNNYGKYLTERTDYLKAANEFRRALYFDPSNTTASENLDAVLSKQGVKANDPGARFQLGDKLRQDAEFELALIEYNKALSLSKTPDPNVHIAIGDIHYILYLREGQKTDDIYKAIDSYKKALAIQASAKAYIKIGDGLLGLRDVVGAIENYKKALQLEADSPDVLAANVRGWNEAVRLAPLVAENHIGLAQALQVKGDYVNAEEEYNQALKLDPDNEIAIKGLESLRTDKLKFQVEKIVKDALKLQSEKKYSEAIAEYVKAIEIAPRDPKLHYNIGTAFQAAGDFEHAEKAYKKALEFDQDNEKARIALESLKKESELKKIQDLTAKAVELQKVGNYQEAITTYLAALSIKQDDARLHYNVGTAYQASGNIENAIKEYEKASELDKENPSYKDAIKIAREEAARPLVQSAIQKQTSGNLLGAIDDYVRALQFLPDDAASHFNLGTAYQAAKQLDNAIRSYLKAVELDSKGQPEAYFFIGTIFEERKDYKQAVENYQKYLQVAPNGSYSSQARELINYLKVQQ